MVAEFHQELHEPVLSKEKREREHEAVCGNGNEGFYDITRSESRVQRDKSSSEKCSLEEECPFPADRWHHFVCYGVRAPNELIPASIMRRKNSLSPPPRNSGRKGCSKPSKIRLFSITLPVRPCSLSRTVPVGYTTRS